jgi:ribonuclease HI
LKLIFNKMSIVYIDGSARMVNGQPRSGFGIFWLDQNMQHLTCQGQLDQATCARAEVMAMKVVLQQICDLFNQQTAANSFIIRCDNMYVVKGVNMWMNKWHRDNYKDRAHPDLWSQIYHYYQSVKPYVTVEHVYSHKGEYGNEMADRLAKGEITVTPNQYTVVSSPSSSTVQQPIFQTSSSSSLSSISVSSLASGPQSTVSVRKPVFMSSQSTADTGGLTPQVPKQNTVPRVVVAVGKGGGSNKLDSFKSWLGDNDVVCNVVQHGQQLKFDNGKTKGGIIFYNNGTVLPQGNWWANKWSEYSVV